MAKCPKCGVKLHIWNIKAECPKCGVNIANYDWENRLEQDAIEAEIAFAKLRESLNRFKYSFVGTKLRIARIPVSVLPLFSFLLPLGTLSVAFPFFSKNFTLNAITIVMEIIGGLDISGVFSGMSSTMVGDSFKMLAATLILVVLSVLSLLVSLAFLMLNFKKFNSKGLFVTNLVASCMMLASSFTFGKFSELVAEGSLASAWQSSPSWGVYVSAALFLASAIINLCVSLQKVELPVIEEEKTEETEETKEEANV
ncbi:MAG: hypothetical protein J6R20_08440 [Clostridia bacterium]|nr:hypothetical protein [Clostridia bacterium]